MVFHIYFFGFRKIEEAILSETHLDIEYLSEIQLTLWKWSSTLLLKTEQQFNQPTEALYILSASLHVNKK